MKLRFIDAEDSTFWKPHRLLVDDRGKVVDDLEEDRTPYVVVLVEVLVAALSVLLWVRLDGPVSVIALVLGVLIGIHALVNILLLTGTRIALRSLTKAVGESKRG